MAIKNHQKPCCCWIGLVAVLTIDQATKQPTKPPNRPTNFSHVRAAVKVIHEVVQDTLAHLADPGDPSQLVGSRRWCFATTRGQQMKVRSPTKLHMLEDWWQYNLSSVSCWCGRGLGMSCWGGVLRGGKCHLYSLVHVINHDYSEAANTRL